VLNDNFEDAKVLFLSPLMAIEYAHLVMLVTQRIISSQDAHTLRKALDSISLAEVRRVAYDGTYEDLFFYIDRLVAAACGDAVAADVAKDITLTTQAEPGSLSADFETLGDWEIGHFDTNWVSVGIGTRAAKVDGGQNTTPGGKSSALIEDIKAVDNTSTELTDPTYEVLQRPSGKRIAVTAGNSYNVYFKLKIENWVITDTTKDCVHYEIRWLDANGAVLDRTYSHPFWIFPQTFWQQYSVGHPAGSDGSVALVRLSPPAGAAFLDLKIGWIRFNSGIDDTNPDPGINPAGTQLFVDDLVVDSFGAAVGAPPTISAAASP
jgi:hypothetical protein